MRYQVVETVGEATTRTLGEFKTVYSAVDFMTGSWMRGEPFSLRMSLVDQTGEVLLDPCDLAEACLQSW